MGRKRIASAERDRLSQRARRRRWLLVVVLPLLALGFACNLYLLNLYVRVHGPDGAVTESFCAVSDRVNCVTVANSSYSAFLGLPIALYGVEFFGLMLVMVVCSAIGVWRVRAWDSLLFLVTLPALPAVAVLAWISSFQIKSVCILCAVTQGSVVLLFLALLLAGRKQLKVLLSEGLIELLAALRGGTGVLVFLVVALGLSQLSWAPPLFRAKSRAHQAGIWTRLPVQGLTIGPPDALVHIEEFTDFQCPHCGKAHQIMMEVLRRYPGKVQLVHRDYPLDMACNPTIKHEFHPHACRAALYARCAAKQDKYWPYEELLFENREQLDEQNLRALAKEVGLDLPRLEQCLQDPSTTQALQVDINEGIRRGLTGTPTLIVDGKAHLGMPPMTFWEKKLGPAGR